jgi:hypothetical protein
MIGWMIQIIIHKSEGNPKALRSFSWPASTEDFISNGEWMDGWMYV